MIACRLVYTILVHRFKDLAPGQPIWIPITKKGFGFRRKELDYGERIRITEKGTGLRRKDPDYREMNRITDKRTGLRRKEPDYGESIRITENGSEYSCCLMFHCLTGHAVPPAGSYLHAWLTANWPHTYSCPTACLHVWLPACLSFCLSACPSAFLRILLHARLASCLLYDLTANLPVLTVYLPVFRHS